MSWEWEQVRGPGGLVLSHDTATRNHCRQTTRAVFCASKSTLATLHDPSLCPGFVEEHSICPSSCAFLNCRQYRHCENIVNSKTGHFALFSLDSFNSFKTERGVGMEGVRRWIHPDRQSQSTSVGRHYRLLFAHATHWSCRLVRRIIKYAHSNP